MHYEIDFLPVGNSNGDAICIRHGTPNGGYAVMLIDGGYSEIGEAVVQHVRSVYGTSHIDNIVLTHADDDHARGLVTVMRACTVGALYMNRPWLYVDEVQQHHHQNFTRDGLIRRYREMHDYLVQLEELAAIKGTRVHEAFQGTVVGPSTILAPSRRRYVELLPFLDKTPDTYSGGTLGRILSRAQDAISHAFEYWDIETLEEHPDPTSPSNETSVVQLAQFGTYRALFTGDVGPQGLFDAANFARYIGMPLRPNLFQIPHQGSRRNVTPSVLDALLGPRLPTQSDQVSGRSTCSVGAQKKSHPRKRVTNALHRRGYPTQVARDSTICFTNQGRAGWTTAPVVPFYQDVTEEA